MTQSMGKTVILFFGDVMMSLVEEFKRTMIAPRPVHMRINWRMVVHVLAIVDRSLLDLPNRFVDLRNRVLFFPVFPS